MESSEIRKKLIRKATEARIPVLGEFELTANCNFCCSFCYLDHEVRHQELDTEIWKQIFTRALESGLMFANLTGGELFLRKDFGELYEYLFDRGVKLTLFTNGSLITPGALEILARKKPMYVAITLYGFDDGSYRETTGVATGFEAVKANIIKLKMQGVNILLRTIPVQSTYRNLDGIIAFVKSLDEKLYYFSYVTKSSPLNAINPRLDAKQLIDFETRINDAFGHKEKANMFDGDYKSCIALRSSYFINHRGEMMPCSLAYKPRKSILQNDFLEVFRELGEEFANAESMSPCHGCPLIDKCNTCYAKRLNEDGLYSLASYLCEIAQKRRECYRIGKLLIYLDYRYPTFLKNNIENYRFIDCGANSYHIRVHYPDVIELPSSPASHVYKNRLIYKTDVSERIYALNQNKRVKEMVEKSLDYRKIDIHLAKDEKKVLAEKEYIFTGIAFLDIASFNGYVPIHGSAVASSGGVVIFSAPSQTGKSTLAANWLKIAPKDRVINDDKPLIYLDSGIVQVCGSPWSGKHVKNINVTLPLRAIVFLEQFSGDYIRELDNREKLKCLFHNINRPKDEASWEKMTRTLDVLTSTIPMYLAKITKGISAANMIMETIYGGKTR